MFFIIRPIDKDFKTFESFLDNFSQKNQHFELSHLRFSEITKIAQTLNETLLKQERTQDELRDALEASQELQKVKEEFLGNMSHELRTPLNGIIGFSEILQKKLPEHALEIDPIVDSSHNLLSLVNDILDFSKIQSGHFTLSHDVFCLTQKLEPFLQQFQVKIQEKEINFTFKSEGIKELYIDADWLRISQILSNILSNAIKFTPQNGLISMDVSYEKERLQIKIKDNGIGISKEALKHIFDPFRQADSSTTKNYGGTGLGLSIAAALADLMNGDITIDSAENKGSMFTVTLKVLQAEKTKQEDESLVEETLQKLQAHILVAEDNKTNQLLMGMILEGLGVSYDMANDGLEAVEMYGNKSYDLVLMDENMPNMNGVDAMQKIHELYKDVVPILAVTANVMKGDEARLLEAGMDGFIPKPIDSKELLHKIQFFLKSR